MNPSEAAYLRGLEKEFNDSTNAIRIELNRFEKAGILNSSKKGNKKMYHVNTSFPLFDELQSLAMKHFGVDRILDDVIHKLGDLKAVYLTGTLAEGHESQIIDLVIIADSINRSFLARLLEKAEKTINRKIRTMILSTNEIDKLPTPAMLIYEAAC